ncbi:hypothetical protein V5F44_11100 [Xanthobacter sp. V2C-8]|uniref:hypothetical protein n=1 Tax=Xanthobacter albus TaxID=3119929 RepID=UPI00372A71A9
MTKRKPPSSDLDRAWDEAKHHLSAFRKDGAYFANELFREKVSWPPSRAASFHAEAFARTKRALMELAEDLADLLLGWDERPLACQICVSEALVSFMEHLNVLMDAANGKGGRA